MAEEIAELREFECRYCGHRVVVNPEFPKEYAPTCCTPCWDNIVWPSIERREAELFAKMLNLFRTLGISAGEN